ncbi:MAG: PilN domain-containing protein [Desulfosporosinus sp.]|nr:PilN domain-containing protein [Desulfosporosinus sp.]
MQQINFFKPYFEERRIKPKQKIIVGSGLVVVVLAGLLIWNIFQIQSLKSRIAGQNNFLNSINIKETKLKMSDTQDKIKKMDTYLQTVNVFAQGLQKEDRINRHMIDSIAAMVPNGLSFQSLAIADSVVTLQGTASNRIAVAELQHQLQISDIFQNVQVKTIVLDDKGNGFIFGIEGTLK